MISATSGIKKNKRAASDTGGAGLMIVAGIFGFTAMLILGIMEIFWGRTDDTPRRVFLTILLGIVFAVVLVKTGISELIFISRCKKLIEIISRLCPDGSRVSIPLLADRRNQTFAELSPDLYRMLARRYLPNASVDLTYKELVLNSACPPVVKEDSAFDTIYKASRKVCLTPFVFAALAWMMIAQVFLISGFAGYITTAVVTVIVFILSMRRFPPYTILSEISKPPEKRVAVNTGDPSADNTISELSELLDSISRLERTISGASVKKSAGELVNIGKEILKYVEKHPEKIRQIKQLSGYYIPFAISLLKSYAELESQPEKGGNISGSMTKIEESMPVLVSVARREHDMLFFDKAMDITADIAVLKSMIEQIEQ